MGDADEAAASLKTGSSEVPGLHAPDIDVINLSSHMISMEILPSAAESSRGRKGKKRVKFDVPVEPRLETRAKSARVLEYRRREAGEYRRARRRVESPCSSRAVGGACSQGNTTHVDDVMEVDSEGAWADVDQESKAWKRRRREKPENVNSNCASKDRDAVNTSAKRKNKPMDILSSKSNNKSRKVVSKKKSVKDDSDCTKYTLEKKRKNTAFLNSHQTKKQKLSGDASISKKKSTSKLKLKISSIKCKRYKGLATKAHIDSKLKAKGKTKSSHKSDKLKRAKEAKRKLLLKKAKEARKLAMKRKQVLKRKLACKKKAAQKLLARKRSQNKPWKIRINPIERDEDVAESLRVNLLKFLTIERAYDHKYECCGRLCWDKWEELDIDDVIADYD